MTDPSCYLCGGADLTVIRETVRHEIPRRVLRCEECGLVRLEPRSDRSIDYTGSEYRRAHSPIVGTPVGSRQLYEIYRPLQEDRIRRIEHLLRADQRALDVGCSAGHFLDALSEHVSEVVGIELSSDNADFVERELGFEVHRRPVEEVGLPPGSFDLITAYQVLEHVEDPLPFLNGIRELLAPGGTVVIEVPNLDDALLSIYDNEAYADFWFREVHVFYYTPATLERMLSAAGLCGELDTVQQYNVLNQLHWLMTGTPQPRADIGQGPPRLPIVDEAAPSLKEELQQWLSRFDARYREILERHGRGENVLFVGGVDEDEQ